MSRPSRRGQESEAVDTFLQEDLAAPDSLYSWEAFCCWLDRCGADFPEGTGFSLPKSIRLSAIEADAWWLLCAQETHRQAIHSLADLQQQSRRVRGQLSFHGYGRETRTQLLPEIAALAREKLLAVESHELWLLDSWQPGLSEDQIRARLAEQESSFGYVHGWPRDWLPASPAFRTLPVYWWRWEVGKYGQLLQRVAVARGLPAPYSRVFGAVCADVLDWLRLRSEVRCQYCDRVIWDETHSEPPSRRRQYCPDRRCKQDASDERRGRKKPRLLP